MTPAARESHNIIMAVILLVSLAFLIAGLFAGDMAELPAGLARIYTSPAPLVTDFTVTGGLGPALCNGGIMGLCVFLLYKFTGFVPGGGAFGAFFLSVGLGLFGKTPLTLAPFVLGGWLYARSRKEPFRLILQYPIQAAALSPVVTVLAFKYGFSLTGLVSGLLIAIAMGFLITPVAVHTRSMHRGFDLYNVGLAAGFMGVAFFSIYRSVYLLPNGKGDDYLLLSGTLGGDHRLFFCLFFGGMFLLMILAGLALDKSLRPFWELRRHTGLDVDFATEYGMGAVLCNMGLVGLMMLGYMLFAGASFNGATAGALICALCWTGNGANTRNIFPVLVGYLFASWFMVVPLNSQYLCISVCYATGLAPLAGRYGGICGICAGMLHAFLAGVTANMHGGFNLYNGGFTAGLTALVLYPIVHHLSRHEYMDYRNEKHPGLVAELAGDAVHLAESAAHLIALDESIVHTLPEDHGESKTTHTFLNIRNVLAIAAGALFLSAIAPWDVSERFGHVLRFAAYILGAGAYGAEIIVLTDGLRRNPGFKEMCMPYVFGVLYVMLGLSYLTGGH